jgi:hypothetical protein
MMKIQDVNSCIDEPVYPSFSEAVLATRTNPRHLEARSTSSQLRGRIIDGFSFGSTWVDLSLSEKCVLHIFLDGGKVCWKLRNGAEGKSSSVDEETLYLKWSHRTEPLPWNRFGLLQGFVGKPVKMITASSAWLFVTVDDLPTIMFSRVTIGEQRQDLLFFDPE